MRRPIMWINNDRLSELNRVLNSKDNVLFEKLYEKVEKHGGVDRINEIALESGFPATTLKKLRDIGSPYYDSLQLLIEKVNSLGFVKRKQGLDEEHAVTLEISALQYFPWFMAQIDRCFSRGEYLPGRFIRVRNMAEQVEDNGDILAISAAMQIIGASYVETLDTRGTDGSNVHLGGPETIAGYFGGVGQPNEYALKWVDEYLHYYKNYGIKQVLNINPGTVMAGYILHKMGIDMEFKISVFMGNDNPFSVFWTLMTAKMFAREDGTTPLVGFNLSNSVNNDTIRESHRIREMFGLTDAVRFEHHITETYKSIVRQPYNRREELIEIAKEVPNIAAKHEGGEPEIEAKLSHPSDILDYFMTKKDIHKEAGLMTKMQKNYIQKHISVNKTAKALEEAGIAVKTARIHD